MSVVIANPSAIGPIGGQYPNQPIRGQYPNHVFTSQPIRGQYSCGRQHMSSGDSGCARAGCNFCIRLLKSSMMRLPQRRLDQQPLISTESLTQNRKRRTTDDPKPPKSRCRPILKLNIPPRNRQQFSQLCSKDRHRPAYSPGSQHSDKYIQEWLATFPTIGEHAPEDIIKSPRDARLSESDKLEQCQKFVMIQIFRKDTLLADDLVPLYHDDNMEINISYAMGTPLQRREDAVGPMDTTNFRWFQISNNDPNSCEEFRKQFGGGIRIFCRKGKEVLLQKSTRLLTYYGSGTEPWTEITSEEKCEPVFNFDRLPDTTDIEDKVRGLSGKMYSGVSGKGEYNRDTACPANVVRISVGCTPTKKIYETDFHVKLSFVMH